MMLDMVKCSGLAQAPHSNKEFYAVLLGLKERGAGATFGTQFDWRGFCTSCYESKLMTLTGAESAEVAKTAATPAQKKEASKFATKAKNSRGFPTNAGGGKDDTFICKDCKNEVRAQVQIQRFLP
jgi:hypothetical protein